MKQAVKEAGRAMKKFLSGAAGRPKFKTKRRTTPRFYVNYESLTRKNGGFHGEKIGFVRTAEPLPKIPKGCHYSNPWISFDGKYWYIGFGHEVPDRLNVELTGDSIGIDLGVKELAVCYAFGERKKTVFKNINKTKEVHRLEKSFAANSAGRAGSLQPTSTITKPYSGTRKSRAAGLSGNGQSENAGILNGSGKE